MAGQLRGRRVDPEEQRDTESFPPGHELATGVAEHPIAEPVDDVEVVGPVDERGGRQEAKCRMGPTRQGFDRRDVAGLGVDLGQVVHPELAGHERRSEVALSQQVAEVRERLRGLVGRHTADPPKYLPPSPSAALGLKERGVGTTDQLVGQDIGVRGDGDADAGRHFGPLAIDYEWLVERVENALSRDGRFTGVAQFDEEHRKLVAS